MKRTFTLIISLCFLVALQAQEVTSLRIGYLDREAVLLEMPQTKTLYKQIEDQKTLFEKEYAIMQNEYNQKVKSYIENSKSMSEPIK